MQGSHGALTLQATDISADGEFKGVIDPASYPSTVFAEGGYRGNFYGLARRSGDGRNLGISRTETLHLPA